MGLKKYVNGVIRAVTGVRTREDYGPTRAAKDFEVGDIINYVGCLRVEDVHTTEAGIRLRLHHLDSEPEGMFSVPCFHGSHHYMEFPSACPECAEEEGSFQW